MLQVTYRKNEKINQERLYPYYDVTKLDKHVVLPVSSKSCISEVKTAIKSAVFSPAPVTHLNKMCSLVPYPIEPVVISFDDEESDSESACSTPMKSSNDTECDSSTVKKNLLDADKTFNTLGIESDFKETEEMRLERILEASYQFYKPDPVNVKIKSLEEIRQEKSGKRKYVEAPYANENAKRMKAESSPSNLYKSLPSNDVKSNSTKEMEIKTASKKQLQKTTLSSSVSPASVTKLPVVEMEKAEQSSGNSYKKSARPAVNIFNSFLLNEGEVHLDYEPDDVLP